MWPWKRKEREKAEKLRKEAETALANAEEGLEITHRIKEDVSRRVGWIKTQREENHFSADIIKLIRGGH